MREMKPFAPVILVASYSMIQFADRMGEHTGMLVACAVQPAHDRTQRSGLLAEEHVRFIFVFALS